MILIMSSDPLNVLSQGDPFSDLLRGDPLSDLLEKRRQERRSVEEAGGGESEGFEMAEDALIEHASHGDSVSDTVILRDSEQVSEEASDASYGEADTETKPD